MTIVYSRCIQWFTAALSTVYGRFNTPHTICNWYVRIEFDHSPDIGAAIAVVVDNPFSSERSCRDVTEDSNTIKCEKKRRIDTSSLNYAGRDCVARFASSLCSTCIIRMQHAVDVVFFLAVNPSLSSR